MKTYWNGQELDTDKKYKINTIASIAGKGNPWYVTGLKYNKDFKMFSFMSTINYEKYGMDEKNVINVEEADDGND